MLEVTRIAVSDCVGLGLYRARSGLLREDVVKNDGGLVEEGTTTEEVWAAEVSARASLVSQMTRLRNDRPKPSGSEHSLHVS